MDRLNQIHSTLTEIQVTLARQEENLKEHMRRTDAVEARVDTVESFLDKDLKPHLNFVGGSIKVFVGFAAIVGVAKLLVELFEFFGR